MNSLSTTLIPIVLLVVVFYFFLIRPENKKKKEQDNMRSNLKKGDKITTIGGVVGRVVQVTDDTLILETSEDRVRLEFAKWAVSTVGVQKDIKDTNNDKKNRKNLSPEEKADAFIHDPAESSDASGDSSKETPTLNGEKLDPKEDK
jgi:preprotein translocase subunit YajC